MAKLTEKFLRESRVKFKEVLQEEAKKNVVDITRFKKAKDMIENCERLIETNLEDTEIP